MKPFTLVSMAVLTLVGVLQLFRAAYGWDVSINNYHVPVWASAVAGVVALVLGTMLWYENLKPRAAA